ncbi:lysine-specific demethylase REF6 [Humulus lupulus]|uniref:lysine-specific demethylase REF6 n=1 Tax=Humulus lupulus TaxID=3486 RepID=UPI002B4048CD|nr:lysine-specific demethylase REF6 [Humulus lupulus]
MAASALGSDPSPEVFSWLKTLPLAPEYHPTLTEFQDPISYIFKIEKEASKYGICKIVPPVSPSPKKTVIANLNKSLAARAGYSEGSNPKTPPTFTTRQQQIGFCPRKPRPVQRPVWQSGEQYTFQEFETKAKGFEKGFLKKCGKKGGGLSPLEIETLYWKATVDKPFSVEYANDMPGSAFVPVSAKKSREAGESVTLGETAWNMRAVSRSKGSLLRFMKEEIPGVTSPMVYVAMLFSWFAWHVEDHDLHSLNYLHMGASKTWYGVPKEAAVAFEEVIRVHGYGAEINPLVTFSILGEKTTVMSPEVFVKEGVPCCRLVQNAGEFVVTFPRAYHTGFSHGFNCAEAANIATPEWLRVANDAAIRRASINYPPMVSHFQLLYDLALALCSRIPVSISSEPRSSRLKDKKKGEGETVVKELFVQDVLKNNDILRVLGKGSPIVLLPRTSSDISVCSKLRVGSHLRLNTNVSLSPSISREEIKTSRSLISDDLTIDRKQEVDQEKVFYSVKGKLASLCEGSWVPSRGNKRTSTSNFKTPIKNVEEKSNVDSDRLSEQRLFSCVTCGILSFACVAIVQPRDPAARYLMTADCSFFNDWVVNAGVASNVFPISSVDQTASKQNTYTAWADNCAPLDSYEGPVPSISNQVQTEDQNNEVLSNSEAHEATSALGLLALHYGNSSDSEEDQAREDDSVYDKETNTTNCSPESKYRCESSSLSFQNSLSDAAGDDGRSPREIDLGEERASQNADFHKENGHNRDNVKYSSRQNFDCSVDASNNVASTETNCLVGKIRDPMIVSQACSADTYDAEATRFCKATVPMKNDVVPFVPLSDEESSRMHVFCLEHAVEVEQQLRQIGGVHILLLCHPDYPKIETEAKSIAEELGINCPLNDTTFRDATKDDQEKIQSALDSEEAMPKNGDWAVKLGINLFYSANLSRSPLYSKQMPYNSVIYNAFGRGSPTSSSMKSDGFGRRSVKKKVVAGKWCGKVWMSNQVHPFLVKRNPDEEEERGILAWAVPDEKPDRNHDSPHRNSNTMVTKKYVRKRKMKVENESIKKAKCIKGEDIVSENSMDGDSHEHHRRSLGNNQSTHTGVGSAKKGKHIQMEDAVSDDSMYVSLKQCKRTLRSKVTTSVETDDIVSDDSLGVISNYRNKKNPRREQAKQVKNLGIQDAVSDGSLDSESNQRRRRIPKSKQAKFMEEEDSASDDFPGTNLYKQQTRIYKSKYAKSIEREDEVSDEPEEAYACHEDKRVLRSKQTKSTMQPKMKQGTGRHVRQPSSQPVKQGTRQLAKKETPKLKQQTPRLRNNQCDQNTSHICDDEEEEGGPSTRLRKRTPKPQKTAGPKKKEQQQQTSNKKAKNASAVKAQAGRSDAKFKDEEAEYVCDVEGCTMSFGVKHELVLHKRNICPVKGCGKKFFSHKYLVQHRRVHMDDRPLRCPWKGCKMTFKWAWARTEHIRVHTGARPYVCAEPGCGQTFRFVSDFSRHKRKTGHSTKKGR